MARSEAGLMPNGQDGVPHHSHWLGTQVPGGPGQPSSHPGSGMHRFFCLFLTPSKKSLDFLEIYFSLLSVVLQNCEMFPWAREPCTWSIDESLE